MAQATLTSIITSVRSVTDQGNSTFITDAEITGWANEGMSELYDLQISAIGADYFMSSTPQSISLVVDTASYSLASDFYKCVGVDYVRGSATYTMREFNWQERNKNQSVYPFNEYYEDNIGYRFQIRGSSIFISPTPKTADTVKVWYVPQMTELSDGSDTTPNSMERSWIQYIIYSAAIKCALKAEEDNKVMMFTQQLNRVEDKVQKALEERLLSGSGYIADVRGEY